MSLDLIDILAVPLEDAAVTKRKTKRITGARDLAAGDYAEMLRADKRRKKEMEEQKQKGKELKEQKKKEKEARTGKRERAWERERQGKSSSCSEF